MKKNTKIIFLSIIMLLCMNVVLFAQDSGDAEKETRNKVASARFSARIIIPIKIIEEQSFISLGTLEPGESKEFLRGDQSIIFTVNGMQDKQITVSGRVFQEADSLKISGLTWEYWDGNNWIGLQQYSTNMEDGEFENFVHSLDEFGNAKIRVYPKKMEAHPDIQEGKIVEFMVQLKCEYLEF